MTPEAKKEVCERLVAARCDSTAILSSLGVLACFTRNAEAMASHTVQVAFSVTDPEFAKDDNYMARWPAVLSKVRKLVDEALNLMGDCENGADCAMTATIDVSEPVFELHRMRNEGKVWEE